MNPIEIERALIHGLDIHLHHNIDKAIDFSLFKELNESISKQWGSSLVLVGPEDNDDAGVFLIPGETRIEIVAKMESHCSPCVVRPYDAAATGAGGAMRDVVAMGARPYFLLDFIGTRPLDQEVVVGSCGFAGKCTCGNCETMTSQERLNLMVKGIRDMCLAMSVQVVGGGLSTSFSDIVPAVVVTVIGKSICDPVTKPAKKVGDKIILIGLTNRDGNDTLFRAGLVSEMIPAEALFDEEKLSMNTVLNIMLSGRVNACSDLGAAGIGAAVCESVRAGGFGAIVDLSKVPLKTKDITPQEALICETQARYIVQVSPEEIEEAMFWLNSDHASITEIGEIVQGSEVTFKHGQEIIATIPNKPSSALLDELRRGS
jgi:phosphoribosylformylglycinamidine synthase subunit PurL